MPRPGFPAAFFPRIEDLSMEHDRGMTDGAPGASNAYDDVVAGFGDEWSRFDQTALEPSELQEMFDSYFDIFPWSLLPKNAVGIDAGCGSGRWAKLVAPRVGLLHCVDASSEALAVAERNLAGQTNTRFHHASVSAMPFPDGFADFAYSLGVLHHLPDTQAALISIAAKLKSGAPFLLYLYYRFDNRPRWYPRLWQLSEVARHVVSRLPKSLRYIVSQAIAVTVYWPLSRMARLLVTVGMNVDAFPLSAYRNRAFYVLRTDALDRFGTRVEQRFTRSEIEEMMRRAGFKDIVFSNHQPYWCAVGVKA
jgi:ubiquinone/menaquinone biosynthesis C-methylase UbiE